MKRIMMFLFIFVISFMLLSCDENSSSTLDPEDQIYTISWLNHDGTVLEVDEVPYGEYPVYDGEEPVKKSTSEYCSVFYGWDSDIDPVFEDKTYKASFIELHISFRDFIQDSEYDFFNSGDLPSFEGGQGWSYFTEDFLLIRGLSDISIYELNDGKTSLVYSFEMNSEEKGIRDVEVDSDGNIFLLGFNTPINPSVDNYMPGFIIEIKSDFSEHSLHDIDNIGMRVPLEFSINSNHEFGIIGEGSDPERAYMQHSFMIFDENYQKLFSYELNEMIRGNYIKIEHREDSFIIAGLVGDSIGCTNGDCMDPIIQEFNSINFLINEITIEYDLRDEILGLIVKEDEINLLTSNNYSSFHFLKLDNDFKEIYNEEIELENPFAVGGIKQHGSLYGIVINFNRFMFIEIDDDGAIKKVYIDELTRLESPFDRAFYMYAKLLVSSFDE